MIFCSLDIYVIHISWAIDNFSDFLLREMTTFNTGVFYDYGIWKVDLCTHHTHATQLKMFRWFV